MTQDYTERLSEINVYLEQKMQEVDEKLAKLERNIGIEKEYVDKQIQTITAKIKFSFKRNQILNQFDEKFDMIRNYSVIRLKRIKKYSKHKSVKNGIKLFKTIVAGYMSINYGIEATKAAIEEIQNAFENTNGIDEIVGLMEDLKNVVKSSYEDIKEIKAQYDHSLINNKDYILLCLKDLEESNKSYDDYFSQE